METANSVERMQQALELRLRTLERLLGESRVGKSDSRATKKRLLLLENQEEEEEEEEEEKSGEVETAQDKRRNAEVVEEPKEEEKAKKGVKEPPTKKQKKEGNESKKDAGAQGSEENELAKQQSTEWVQRVKDTKNGALRLQHLNPRDRPLTDFTDLVARVCSVLKNAPVTSVSALNRISNGHFKLLLIKTHAMMKQMQEVDSKAVQLKEAATTLQEAIARFPELVESFSKVQKPTKKPVVSEDAPRNSEVPGAQDWERHVASLVKELEGLAPPITIHEMQEVVTNFEAVVNEGTTKERILQGLLTRNQNGRACVPHLFTAVDMLMALLQQNNVNEDFLPSLKRVRIAVKKLVAVDKKKLKLLLQHKHDICGHINRIVLRSLKSSATTVAKTSEVTEQPSYVPFEKEIIQMTKLKSSRQSQKRSAEILDLVRTLHQELDNIFPESGKAKPAVDTMVNQAAMAVNELVTLACKQPLDDDSRTCFQDFLELLFAMRARYSGFQHLNAKARELLYDHLYNKKETATKSSGKKDPQIKSKDEKKDEKVLLALKQARGEANTWKDNVFSLKQFDAVMKKLRSVMNHKSSTWDVLRDADVLKCLQLMQTRVEAIAKKPQKARADTLSGWINQMEIK